MGYLIPYLAMHPILSLHIDRLHNGKVEEIKGLFSPAELDLVDEGLPFTEPIEIEGKGYVAEGELLFNFSLKTEVELPCVVCNEPVKTPVHLNGVYKTFSLDEIRGGVCNLVPAIREEVILALPAFVECEEGACPSRAELKQFLRAEGECDHYRPFEELE